MTGTLGILQSYRRLLVLAAASLAAAFVLTFVFTRAAHAYGGPHGNYDASTDKCAACHRAHQGKTGDLLKEASPFKLCISCHNGTGSVLDVVDGVRIDAVPGAAAGVFSIIGAPSLGTYSPTGGPGINSLAVNPGSTSFTLSGSTGTTTITVDGASRTVSTVPFASVTGLAVNQAVKLSGGGNTESATIYDASASPVKLTSQLVNSYSVGATMLVDQRTANAKTASSGTNSAGAMTVTVSSTTGFAAGQIARITGGGNSEAFTVTGLTGGLQLASPGLLYTYAAGATVIGGGFDPATISHSADVVARVNNNGYDTWITPAAQPIDTISGNGNSMYTIYVQANSSDFAGTATVSLGNPFGRDGNGNFKSPLFGAATIQTPTGTSTVSTTLSPTLPDNMGSSVKSTVISIPKGTAASGDMEGLPITVSDGVATSTLSVVTWVDNNYSPALLAGGFEYINGKRVTSRHPADPAFGFDSPWGFNSSVTDATIAEWANGNGDGTPTSASVINNTGQNSTAMGYSVECVSCHNPHGSPNYRILNEKINGRTVTVRAFDNNKAFVAVGSSTTKASDNTTAISDSFVPDEPNKDYLNARWGSVNADTSNANVFGGFSNLCAACHTAYASDDAAAGLTGGTPSETHYRHRTEMWWGDWPDPRGDTFTRSNPSAWGYTTKGGTSITKLPLANVPYAGGNFDQYANYQNNGAAAYGVQNSESVEYADHTVGTVAPSNGAPTAYVVTCVTCHRPHGTDAVVNPVGVAGGFSPLGQPSPAQMVDDGGIIESLALESTSNRGTVNFALGGTETVTFTYGGTQYTTAVLAAATQNQTTLAAVASDLQAKLRAKGGDNNINVWATAQPGSGTNILLVNGPKLLTINSSTSADLNTALGGKSNGDTDNQNQIGTGTVSVPPSFRNAGIANQSTLLRLNERGVCETCHQWSGKGDGTVGP